MPSFSLPVCVLLLSIASAQAAGQETSPAVVVDKAILGKALLEDVAWSDVFTSENDVHGILISYCSSVMFHTEVGDRLASELTMQQLQELIVRASSKSQERTEGTHKFVMFTLEDTQYFFTNELPRLLRSSIVTLHKFGVFTLQHTRYFFTKELRRLLLLLVVTCLVYFVLYLLHVFMLQVMKEVMEEREKSRNEFAAMLH